MGKAPMQVNDIVKLAQNSVNKSIFDLKSNMNVDEVRKQIMGSVDQVLLAHRGVDGQMRTAAQSVDASVKDL